MFDNEEKQLREMKSELDKLPIPTEQLNDAIQQGVLVADAKWRTKRRKRRKSLWMTVAAAVLLLAFVTSIRVSPAFANAVASIPGMGKLVEYIQFDKGLQGVMDNEYYQSIHASQTKDDMTLTIDGVILDESGIVIAYTLEAPYSIEDLDYKDIKLYHNGEEMPPGMMSYNNPDQKHPNRREDLIQIVFGEKPSLKGQDFVLELQLKGAKETVFSLPFTLPKEVKKGKVFVLDKEIEVENQKMTIQEVTIYPLRVEVKVAFDESNTMEILYLEDLRIEDDRGEVWSSTRNGVIGQGGSAFYLESNYFKRPEKLYLKLNKIQAILKDESYLLVDLQKKEVLKQPSDGKFEVTTMTSSMLEGRIREEVIESERGYFIFSAAEDADGNDVGYASQGNWNYEGYENYNIKFEKQPYKNPIRINFSAYPNYINGDISIELK
ncbi:DUF4179 domain-containing protein [Sporosarcina sp. FSL K6-1522]|uniref:DUF4179 domain-containing protein n=1 Tax=Sporosarcina sp. FSL K6-1522 TaxID=2921554 RepID=UPI003159C23D